jgi:lipopolysaccharide biosynthesis regulator YciM
MSAVDTVYATGFWLLEQERPHDAVHVFRTMLALAPADERGWLALGECHHRRGELEKAARIFRLGIASCGATVRLLLASARASRTLGQDDQSDEAYDAAWDLAVEKQENELVRVIEIERSAA